MGMDTPLSYDCVASPTEAPTNAPTNSPTNSPTWQPHIFVPSFTRNVPWFFSYTNAPTGGGIEYDDVPSSLAYVPATAGKSVLSFCLGFGGNCHPVYGSY